MYLPDTNIFILALKSKQPDASFLQKAISQKELVISTIVVGEFYSQNSEEDGKKFESILKYFQILSVDENTAKLAGEYRKQFLRKSKRIFLLDCFLAAQAKLNDLTLVTHNKTDFPMKDIKVISP